MADWPTIKTVHSLVADEIIPCSEVTLRGLAKEHGIGRKLGRTLVFTPEDVGALLDKLPCPSNSSDAPAVLRRSQRLDFRDQERAFLVLVSAGRVRRVRQGSNPSRAEVAQCLKALAERSAQAT